MFTIIECNEYDEKISVREIHPGYGYEGAAAYFEAPMDPTHTRVLYEDDERIRTRGGFWGKG